jgi:hypothetical protein
MRIKATLDESTVASLLDQLLPVTIDLHETEPGTRWVRVEKPERFDFVAGEGIRVHTAAAIRWTALGIAIPVTIKSIALILRPAIITDEQPGGSLVFRPEIEGTDFKMVPAFVDARIARAINAELSKQGDRLAWPFGTSLALRTPLPPSITPATQFELAAEDAVVETTDHQLTLELTLSMRFTQTSASLGDK